MSTRLIMPVPPNETLRTRPMPFQPMNVRKARRMLFGKPAKDEALRFVARELKELQKAQSKKYNFDFDKGIPLSGPNTNYEYVSCELVHAPVKKRPVDVSEEEIAEADMAYFKPEELISNCLREDCNSEKENSKENEATKEKKQMCITDFMPQRKRNGLVADKSSDVALVPKKTMKLELKS
ncbi:uncharacterized protein [Onthophagus taurus]|uniref:uncharacterized protein n=1 Tax=Onthophagus taurus TaxID=166361 RepID=UPI000C203FAC|nr:uncharacterized protein LOC111415623 [Onthophagus taurus]